MEAPNRAPQAALVRTIAPIVPEVSDRRCCAGAFRSEPFDKLRTG
jgi:hypothetical protein